MQNLKFSTFNLQMTPKNKLLAVLLALVVMLIALIAMLAVAVGGTILALSGGLARGIRQLFSPRASSIGQSSTRQMSTRRYGDLDPDKRIEPPKD